MVNKREKNLLYNFYFQQTAVLVLYFFNFIPFFLHLSSFSPHFFRFNFVVSERNVHILFCWHIWVELSLLFWTFQRLLSGTIFPVGGGGCTRTQCTPAPAYAPAIWVCTIVAECLNPPNNFCWFKGISAGMRYCLTFSTLLGGMLSRGTGVGSTLKTKYSTGHWTIAVTITDTF